MRFGTYAKESNTLALVSRSGSLTFKMMRRGANFKPTSLNAVAPPPEQDTPLNIPKKTRLYLEQMEREKELAPAMHKLFQLGLRRLRLSTARAFVKTVADGGSALATVSGASLRMNAIVAGMGPSFKIKLDLTVRFWF